MSSVGIRADFFALRILTHPTTKHTVYLLYDIHASVDKDPAVLKEFLKKVGKWVDDAIENDPMLASDLEGDPWELGDPISKRIEEQAPLTYVTLPNLLEQQQDLIIIIKGCNLSIIGEGWAEYDKKGHIKYSDNYAVSITGNPIKKAGQDYRNHVSPVVGLGKKLFGETHRNKIDPIPETTAYFYNPDSGTGIESGSSAVSEDVDNIVMNGLAMLFAPPYNQTSVIVAVEFKHGFEVARRLIHQKGYLPGNFIISADLARRRALNVRLNDFLQGLATNNKDLYDWFDESKMTYDLIASPLDLAAVFEKELKCGISGKSPEPVRPVGSREETARFNKAIEDGDIAGVRSLIGAMTITGDTVAKAETLSKKAQEQYEESKRSYNRVIELLRT